MIASALTHLGCFSALRVVLRCAEPIPGMAGLRRSLQRGGGGGGSGGVLRRRLPRLLVALAAAAVVCLLLSLCPLPPLSVRAHAVSPSRRDRVLPPAPLSDSSFASDRDALVELDAEAEGQGQEDWSLYVDGASDDLSALMGDAGADAEAAAEATLAPDRSLLQHALAAHGARPAARAHAAVHHVAAAVHHAAARVSHAAKRVGHAASHAAKRVVHSVKHAAHAAKHTASKHKAKGKSKASRAHSSKKHPKHVSAAAKRAALHRAESAIRKRAHAAAAFDAKWLKHADASTRAKLLHASMAKSRATAWAQYSLYARQLKALGWDKQPKYQAQLHERYKNLAAQDKLASKSVAAMLNAKHGKGGKGGHAKAPSLHVYHFPGSHLDIPRILSGACPGGSAKCKQHVMRVSNTLGQIAVDYGHDLQKAHESSARSVAALQDHARRLAALKPESKLQRALQERQQLDAVRGIKNDKGARKMQTRLQRMTAKANAKLNAQSARSAASYAAMRALDKRQLRATQRYQDSTSRHRRDAFYKLHPDLNPHKSCGFMGTSCMLSDAEHAAGAVVSDAGAVASDIGHTAVDLGKGLAHGAVDIGHGIGREASDLGRVADDLGQGKFGRALNDGEKAALDGLHSTVRVATDGTRVVTNLAADSVRGASAVAALGEDLSMPGLGMGRATRRVGGDLSNGFHSLGKAAVAGEQLAGHEAGFAIKTGFNGARTAADVARDVARGKFGSIGHDIARNARREWHDAKTEGRAALHDGIAVARNTYHTALSASAAIDDAKAAALHPLQVATHAMHIDKVVMPFANGALDAGIAVVAPEAAVGMDVLQGSTTVARSGIATVRAIEQHRKLSTVLADGAGVVGGLATLAGARQAAAEHALASSAEGAATNAVASSTAHRVAAAAARSLWTTGTDQLAYTVARPLGSALGFSKAEQAQFGQAFHGLHSVARGRSKAKKAAAARAAAAKANAALVEVVTSATTSASSHACAGSDSACPTSADLAAMFDSPAALLLESAMHSADRSAWLLASIERELGDRPLLPASYLSANPSALPSSFLLILLHSLRNGPLGSMLELHLAHHPNECPMVSLLFPEAQMILGYAKRHLSEKQ